MTVGPDDPVTLDELAVSVGRSIGSLRTFAVGPFLPDRDGLLSLRQAFALATLVELPMLPEAAALEIAVMVGTGSTIGGTDLVAMGWKMDGKPSCRWLPSGEPILGPLFLIPADAMFTRLADAVSEYRPAKARPN